MVGGRWTGSGRRLRALLCVVAAVVMVPLVGLPASATDGVVQFPDLAELNAATTDYVIGVDDVGGTGTLVANWYVDSDFRELAEVALPRQGQVTLPLSSTVRENLDLVVWVDRCPGATWVEECVPVDQTSLRVWVGAAAEIDAPYVLGSPATDLSWTYVPEGTGTAGWRLLAADGSVLSQGSTGAGPGGRASVAVPVGTPHQTGALELTMSLDSRVGHLDGRQVHELVLDGQAPAPPTVTLSDSVFFPYEDGYRDTVTVQTSTDPSTYVKVWMDDEAGHSYLLDSYLAGQGPRTTEVRGRDGLRYLYGTHRVRVVSTDTAGNSTTTVSAPITLDARRMGKKTWRRTLPATRTVVDRTVGACGALRTPASRGWRRSLAYVSGRCRPIERSVVQALHAVRVPRSPIGRYHSIDVSFFGGPSRGALRGSYLVMGYHPAADPAAFEHRRVFTGMRLQRRVGEKTLGSSADALVHGLDRRRRPYVLWSTGLAGGSRYDVRSFTVSVTYHVLVDPPQR